MASSVSKPLRGLVISKQYNTLVGGILINLNLLAFCT